MNRDENFLKLKNVYSQNYRETDFRQLQNHSSDFDPTNDCSDLMQSTNIYDPLFSFSQQEEFEEEPPLLEELEIYPDQIAQKMLIVLNPFKNCSTHDLIKDSDLAGPIFFYLIYAACLFLSGSSSHFSYVYGISVLSCAMMYCLLTLMTYQNVFSLTTVASILGYSLIPIISLSIFRIFISLKGSLGAIIAIVFVLWSSVSASRLFVAISGDKEQQPLIAYPCALVSAVYILLISF